LVNEVKNGPNIFKVIKRRFLLILIAIYTFAIDFAYDLGEHKSDDDLRASMADALDDFFGNCQDCDIF
jgi:hypothetical protein